ncbi:MAG: RHS repeat-associated core domain-containing protein [Planctomycetes bacterium]|nr:RHS repeat-associated core domain-containing protein [Planctomycetota bacterium]
MIAELQPGASGGTGVPPVAKRYVWGLDLAGQSNAGDVGPASSRSLLESAGGIGGLLSVYDYNGAATDLKYIYCYDANGNATQLLDPAATTVSNALVVRYEYDPYGNAVVATGTYATSNRWRFSTKTFDAETGLGYWGYRYYFVTTGRWANRDLLAEYDAVLLYGYVGNRPVDDSDILGQISIIREYFRTSGPKGCGGFDVRWKFKLDQRKHCAGFLVQKVQMHKDIAKCEDKRCPILATPIAPFQVYWEAWWVGEKEAFPVTDGTFTDSAHRADRKGTCGTFSQTGEVRFFCNRDILNFGMKFGEVPEAGGLWSTAVEPPWWNTAPINEGPAFRVAASWWDCCCCSKDRFNFVFAIP